MYFYKTKSYTLKAVNYKSLRKKANVIFSEVTRKSNRKPYIKCQFFEKRKIFFSLFWKHLSDKNINDRTRRLEFFACTLELLRKRNVSPIRTFQSKSLNLYRIYGISGNKKKFVIQIKESVNLRKKILYLISVFPYK